MTPTIAARPAPAETALRGARIGALAGALVAAVGVWAVWRVFVGTRRGQLLAQAAFEGAALGRTSLWKVAEPVLDVVSVPFIATVLGLSVIVALVRRRWLLAGQVALFMAGANLTTQVLKYGVLERPDLGVGDRLVNTLPSGHTTAAASCAVALVLVAPRRWRAVTAVAELPPVEATVAVSEVNTTGRYPEYHTSLDDKSLISFETLSQTIDTYLDVIRTVDENRVYLCGNSMGGSGTLGITGIAPQQSRKLIERGFARA